jgi:hypothetical protein
MSQTTAPNQQRELSFEEYLGQAYTSNSKNGVSFYNPHFVKR